MKVVSSLTLKDGCEHCKLIRRKRVLRRICSRVKRHKAKQG